MPSPYVDRPLEPALIAATHIDPTLGFEIATTLLLAATAVAIYLLLREWHPPNRALAGVALMGAAYPVFDMTRDPYSNDPVGFFCVSVGLLLALQRRWWALAAVVFVGTMAREASAYVLVPAIALAIWDRRRPSLGFWAALVAPVAAVAVVCYSRIFYPQAISYGTDHRLADVLEFNRSAHGSVPAALIWAVCVSIGVVGGVLAIVGYRKAPVQARLCALVLVPPVLSMVIGSDWYRYLAFGLPALILLATFADVTTVGLLVAAAFEMMVGVAVFVDVAPAGAGRLASHHHRRAGRAEGGPVPHRRSGRCVTELRCRGPRSTAADPEQRPRRVVTVVLPDVDPQHRPHP